MIRWLLGYTACCEFDAEPGVVYRSRVMPGWKQLAYKVWAWGR